MTQVQSDHSETTSYVAKKLFEQPRLLQIAIIQLSTARYFHARETFRLRSINLKEFYALPFYKSYLKSLVEPSATESLLNRLLSAS